MPAHLHISEIMLNSISHHLFWNQIYLPHFFSLKTFQELDIIYKLKTKGQAWRQASWHRQLSLILTVIVNTYNLRVCEVTKQCLYQVLMSIASTWRCQFQIYTTCQFQALSQSYSLRSNIFRFWKKIVW